jgi:hypothetical protein
MEFSPSDTITELATYVARRFSLQECNMKFLLSRHGILQPPFARHSDVLLLDLKRRGTKITLLAPSEEDLLTMKFGPRLEFYSESESE